MNDRVFTGDTLLIKGTGRTDFQNGNSYEQYHSIFDRLLKLPEETFVYPAHDYKGENVSTIGEEKNFNPRLQVSSSQEYAKIMENLNLSNPKMMDIAVPTNKSMGLKIDLQKQLNGIDYKDLIKMCTIDNTLLIDLREESEIEKKPSLKNSTHIPYSSFQRYFKDNEKKLANKKIVFYCAVGERSSLAVQICQSFKFQNVCHLIGGINNI